MVRILLLPLNLFFDSMTTELSLISEAEALLHSAFTGAVINYFSNRMRSVLQNILQDQRNEFCFAASSNFCFNLFYFLIFRVVTSALPWLIFHNKRCQEMVQLAVLLFLVGTLHDLLACTSESVLRWVHDCKWVFWLMFWVLKICFNNLWNLTMLSRWDRCILLVRIWDVAAGSLFLSSTKLFKVYTATRALLTQHVTTLEIDDSSGSTVFTSIKKSMIYIWRNSQYYYISWTSIKDTSYRWTH